jgi:hypothetical protein
MPRGSAPGERRGGRQKGTPNKATIERRMLARRGLAAVEHTGKLPLEIILAVAAGGTKADEISDRQLQAAIAAAPYIHPKLAAVAVQDVTPHDPDADAKRAQFREWCLKMLQGMAKPEPLVIDQGE